MTQMQFDISDELAAWVQKKAAEMNLTVSTYVVGLIQQNRKKERVEAEETELDKIEIDRELARQNGWPDDFFDLFGCCKDDPIELPEDEELPLKEITL